ncbi:TPM domain-containing protein [Ramlibacter sp. G-1-2-2]|uniref:TPM domain-containing protein n=1 Tax=Ramlibacter agri TaxID=2728837 RepID=A0A848HC56_9BURK|nr:TPM domain-containing protein [Ramlibacter agri]NML48636.1 TPM domain-containing protein [Ramlibacter agri]
MLHKLLRLFRHRWHDESDTRRALPPEALERLRQRVAASETRHSGELRICVESGLPFGYVWRGHTAHDRAVTLFGKLRVWDTEHNNGVLIYLLLAEHAIEIVADRGLNARIDAIQWTQLVERMRSAFQGGQFEEGLGRAVDEVTTLLVAHFPLAPGEANPNELPDEPVVR